MVYHYSQSYRVKPRRHSPLATSCCVRGHNTHSMKAVNRMKSWSRASPCAQTQKVLSTRLIFSFLCKDESPTGQRPPHPGLGLLSNELSVSVPTSLVATCAHCEQLAGGRETVGFGLVLFPTKQMKHKANCNEKHPGLAGRRWV